MIQFLRQGFNFLCNESIPIFTTGLDLTESTSVLALGYLLGSEDEQIA
jgi:hypothetical protein